METACVSDELCRFLKEEVHQIKSLGDSCIEHVSGHLAQSSGPGV